MINNDGIHKLLPEENMTPAAKRRREVYKCTPNVGWVNTEFGYYSLDKWLEDGHISGDHDQWVYDDYMKQKFLLNDTGDFFMDGIGWEASEFYPMFDVKLLKNYGNKDLLQDEYGREIMVFAGKRSGFMPEYKKHPVEDRKSWEEKCAWRLNPDSPERYEKLMKRVPDAIEAAKKGNIIVQRCVGGYMYLRSLVGPEDICYMLYDEPDLIHTMMENWLELADRVSAFHQQYVTIDEFFIGEDICYNVAPLISPDMIREFLFPYYKELIKRIKSRQIDKDRHLYLHLDTDGHIESVMGMYQELGFDVFSPFEVASHSDVVRLGKEFPNAIMIGGIDKRMYNKSREELKEYLDGILETMKERGGFIPTCDHGVPEEANFDNYCYYRKRSYELSNLEIDK